MRKLMYPAMLLLFVSCKKETYNIDNLNGGKINKLGHAGMGTGDTYPMNSAESIRKCLTYSMDGSEMDVQMTSDGVLVAFHDETLDEKTDLSGLVNDHSWEEIKKGKFIVTPHVQYNLVRIDEMFAGLDSKNFVFSFDLKLHTHGDYASFCENYKNALIALIESYTDPAKIMIESQDTVFLNKVKAEKPLYQLFYYPPSFEDGLAAGIKFGYKGITISTRSVSKEQIAEAHLNGLQVATWNTHTKRDNREAILKNPDIIETDKVEFLSKAIE